MPRILLIIVALLLLAGVAVAVYFFFFTPKNTVVVTPGTTFGDSGAYQGGNTDTPAPPLTQEAVTVIAPRFIKITDGPVATGLLLRTPSTTPAVSASTTDTSAVLTSVKRDTELRFVERASGNIYAFHTSDNTLTRVTNQTLPGVVSAVWAPDASRAFVRFISNNGTSVETFALSEREEDGYFLETGLDQVSIGADRTVLTLLPSTTGSIATSAKLDGTNARTVFSSPLSALRIFALGKDFVAYTKASASSDGYAFLVGGATGVFERVLGPLRGLTVLPSHNGKTLLVSYRSGNALRLELFDVATRVSTSLPVVTLSEKCVWNAGDTAVYCAVPKALSGTVPDDWYQGAVSFSDRIWKVSVTDRVATMIVDIETLAGESVDAVSLSLDDATTSLGFVSRVSGSLWLYSL